jgi:hypothetical protein
MGAGGAFQTTFAWEQMPFDKIIFCEGPRFLDEEWTWYTSLSIFLPVIYGPVNAYSVSIMHPMLFTTP